MIFLILALELILFIPTIYLCDGNINNYDNFLYERIKGSIKDLEKFKEFTTFLTVRAGRTGPGISIHQTISISARNGRRCRNVLELLIDNSKITLRFRWLCRLQLFADIEDSLSFLERIYFHFRPTVFASELITNNELMSVAPTSCLNKFELLQIECHRSNYEISRGFREQTETHDWLPILGGKSLKYIVLCLLNVDTRGVSTIIMLYYTFFIFIIQFYYNIFYSCSSTWCY